MNEATKIVFMSTPVIAAISTAAVVAAACLGFWSWRRSGYRRAHGIQELVRVAIVAVVALLFNQPEWVEEFRPEEKPTIAIYWDTSRSMQTRDVQLSVGNRGSAATALSRAAAIEPLTKRETWKRIGDRLQIVAEPIPAPKSGEGTDLHAILAAAPERVSNLLGVVLISDGDWNAGRPPGEAASRLRMRNVPVFTVLAGSPEPLPDIELMSVDLPTFGVSGKVVRVPFTIESTLPRDYVTTVTLKTSDGETLTRDLRVAAMGRTSDAFTWKPAAAGDLTATVEVPRHADELVSENNTKSAPIAIRPERLRVLLVESYPRWEYRYLRNALTRDPGVELSCLLFHLELSKPGGGAKNYIKEFPPGIEELSAYDVVFLGDVGAESGQLTAEQCRMIKGLVEHQASGLVFMPGWQGRQFSLLETELSDLYPVHLDSSQPGGWGSRTASQFELTERGRDSLLTRLADAADENVAVWEELPGFQWYAPVVRAKAGSEVLAVHADASNEYGRLPLLATRTYGAGKVLFMGTDGAWRWRKGVEDLYHYRFWGQVVRWMAYQRNMAKGETMRLFYTPDQPKLRGTMSLHAHVMQRSGEPLSRGDVVARITAPSGKVETVRLAPEGEEWGVFHGRHVPTEPGRHLVTLACKQTSATLDAQFFVPGQTAEPVGKPARPEVLQELARMTKGRAVTVSEANIDSMIRSLSELPLPPPSIRRLQLWSHPLAATAVVVLLAGFWVLRKAIGLI